MTARRLVLALSVACAVLALTGCGAREEKPASSLTEAERDTALARSSLPGAGVVQRALDVNGVATERASDADSAGR